MPPHVSNGRRVGRRAEFREKDGAGRQAINDDIVFETELIKQVETSVDYILRLFERVTVDGTTDDEWQTFIAARRESELKAIIADENLRADRTRELIDTAFRDGAIRTSGTAIARVLPPASRCSVEGDPGNNRPRVIGKPGTYFEWLCGLSASGRD